MQPASGLIPKQCMVPFLRSAHLLHTGSRHGAATFWEGCNVSCHWIVQLPGLTQGLQGCALRLCRLRPSEGGQPGGLCPAVVAHTWLQCNAERHRHEQHCAAAVGESECRQHIVGQSSAVSCSQHRRAGLGRQQHSSCPCAVWCQHMSIWHKCIAALVFHMHGNSVLMQFRYLLKAGLQQCMYLCKVTTQVTAGLYKSGWHPATWCNAHMHRAQQLKPAACHADSSICCRVGR